MKVGKSSANQLRVLFRRASLLNRSESLACDYLILPRIFTSQSLIDAAKSKGLSVWSYGSDDSVDLRQAAAKRIAGLIVDYPDAAIKIFE